MLLLAKTVLSGWWQGPVLIALLFQVPVLQWCSLSLLALITLRSGPVSGGISLLALVLGSALFVSFVPNAALPVIGLVSAVVTLGAAQVLRATMRPVLSWVAISLLLVSIFAAISVFFPHLFSAYEVPARVMVEAWFSNLNNSDGHRELVGSIEALVVQIVVAMPLMLASVSVILGRFWQSKLFNPGGFAQEIQSSRVDAPIAGILITFWLVFQFHGEPLLYGLANVFLLPFMLAGVGVFHWLGREKQWNMMWYAAFYTLLVVTQIGVVLLAVVDTMINLRWRLKRGVQGGSS